ncbi:MAG: sulfite exporter TauE/SafE family protein [Rhodospirillales bacterium]
MGLGVSTIGFLFIGAAATAVISAIVGFGGGLSLFALLALVLDFALLIPIYGAVQFSSAASRVWFFRKDIVFPLFRSFLIAFLPCYGISVALWLYLIEAKEAQPYLKMAIGVYLILYVGIERMRIEGGDPKRLAIWAGIISGLLSNIVAVGAIQAPFFAGLKLRKEEFVALMAVASAVVNGLKIPLFLFILDRLSVDAFILIALLALASFLGAGLGRRVIGVISEVRFRQIFYAALILIAAKLFFWDGVRVLWP